MHKKVNIIDNLSDFTILLFIFVYFIFYIFIWTH